MSTPVEKGSVPGLERSSPRRWWYAYPSPTTADLDRIARLEVGSWEVFPWHTIRLTDRYVRSLLLDEHLNPGACTCLIQDLRARIEQTARERPSRR